MSKDKDNQNKPAGAEKGAEKPAAEKADKGAEKGQKQHQGKPGGKGGPKGGGSGKGPKHDSPQAQEALKPSGPPRLKTLYDEKIRGAVAEKFGLKNPMQQPRLRKITLNVNMGRHLEGTKIPPNVKTTVNDTIRRCRARSRWCRRRPRASRTSSSERGWRPRPSSRCGATACGTFWTA
jgi:hypothetical protein